MFCVHRTLIIMHKLQRYYNEEHLKKKTHVLVLLLVMEAFYKMCVYLGTP